MQKLLLTLFFIVLFSSSVSALIVVNEIMFNPVGDEDNEFVEIYYNSWVNLSGYTVEDLSSSDILKEVKVENNSNYALIVENSFNFSGINSSVYTIGSSIGSGLNNDGDLIILRDNKSKIIDLVYYSDSWGGDDNGFSIERIDTNGDSNDKDNWKDSLSNNGTPGNLNSVVNQNDCDWNVFVLTEKDIFNITEFEFKVRLEKIKGENKQNFTIKRKIINSENKVIKDYELLDVENVLNSKTLGPYSPNLDGNDAYYLNVNITNLTCNDNNLNNNYNSKLVFIKDNSVVTLSGSNSSNNEGLNKNESKLDIIKIFDEDSIKFGDVAKVKIKVYKGDTQDYSIKLFIEDDNGKDVSEISNIHIFGKFREETLTLPLAIKDNCNLKFGEGKYNLILEGLDKIKEEDIEIKYGKCEETKTESSSVSLATSGKSTQSNRETIPNVGLSENLESDNKVNEEISGKIIYESDDIKIGNYGLYFFSLTLVILIIYLLIKKDL